MTVEEMNRSVKRAMAHEKVEFQKRVDYWTKRKGRKVRHRTYLLLGNITDIMIVPISSLPRLIIQWDNGAESSELPNNIQLLKRRKKK